MTWYECTVCEEEFRVISESTVGINWCPFCGSEIEHEEDDDFSVGFEDDED